nr:copia protein [Tanacetum cinerariifolium]
MSNRHQELTSSEQTVSELPSPKQTGLGKGNSNLFMAGSLPKTIWSQVNAIEGFTISNSIDILNHLCLQTLSYYKPYIQFFTSHHYPKLTMVPLTSTDTHNIVAFLSKSNASEGFDQIMDFLIAHTIQYALVVLVDLPKGKRAIGSKWVFRNKKDNRRIVIKNKARLVAHGHTQEEGIDYDEFFAPVARIEAIRLFLAYASFMGFIVYQMDVKSAFLYGTIEEEAQQHISNDSPLLGVNTPRCDEDNIELKELMVFMATATIKKVNDDVQLRALIDGKKVVVTEDVIRRDLHLDDADGVECLPNEEIFAELARMGYEKPPPKLTFYKAFFSAQRKLLIHTLVQCLSAKRTTWNDFSCSMASVVICLAT